MIKNKINRSGTKQKRCISYTFFFSLLLLLLFFFSFRFTIFTLKFLFFFSASAGCPRYKNEDTHMVIRSSKFKQGYD